MGAYRMPLRGEGLIESPGGLVSRWVERGLFEIQERDWEGVPAVACWAGTLEPEGGFGVSLANWSPAARERLDRVVDELVAQGRRVILRPHARHVLSDWNQCLRFLVRREAAGDHLTGLLADPISMLTAQMLPRVEDHLERAFEELTTAFTGECGDRVMGVVVCGVEAREEGDPLGIDEGEPLRLCALDDPASVVTRGFMENLLKTLPAGLPFVIPA